MLDIELRKKYELEVSQGYMTKVAIYINEAMCTYDKQCDNAYNRAIMAEYKNLVYQENGQIKISKSGCMKLFEGYFESNFDDSGHINISKFVLNMINVPKNIKIIYLNNRISSEVDGLRWKYLDNPSSDHYIYGKLQAGINQLQLILREDEEVIDDIEDMGADEFLKEYVKDGASLQPLFDDFANDIETLHNLLVKRQALLR